MKNLIVESQQTNVFSDHNYLRYDQCLSCYDPDKDRFYTIGGPDNRLIGINVASDKKEIDQKVYFKTENAKPVGIEYSSIEQELYVATDEGRVYQFTPNTESVDNRFWHQEVADFPEGLQAISLSPDQEVVVLFTKDFNVITLSAKFDVIKETNVAKEEFGSKQFITVGWGKKETQFHGSEGKAAAKAQQTVTGKTDLDNGLPKITWKGDGSLFAISYIDTKARARRFKVLDREGELQYTSELVDCLEGTLSWKPSGNLIASSRKLPNKHTIALFEKNGLLHREFTLPFDVKKKIQIQDLVWSRDSDVLSVWYKDLATGITCVDLWSEKNYHWYLKQSISYPKTNQILYVYWYPQVKRDLIVLSCRNSTIYKFYWGVSHSNGKQLDDKAVVGVIDNDKVLLTCFKDGIVPPPMAQQTMQFKKPVNAISFYSSNCADPEISSNDFLVLLSNNKIVHCTNTSESWETQYKVKKTYNVDLNMKDSHKYSTRVINHVYWYKAKIILCSVSLGNRSKLCELDLMDIDVLDEILIDAKVIHEMPGQIEHIIPSSDCQSAYVVADSKLFSYSDRDGLKRSNQLITELARAMTKIELVRFGEKEILVALSRKHVLYVDEKQVANSVTSFLAHSEFLLITTLQHALICFKLDEHGLSQLCTSDLSIQPWEKSASEMLQSQEISIRRVERGSTLIAAVPKDARTILQMPRGNLECVQPRALSLAIIASFIDQLDYLKAFDLMRKQRIDLNLLYDHDPASFAANADRFVSEINNSNWLSLFLTELNEEDVTRTTYSSSYQQRRKDESKAAEKNVEEICRALREILERDSSEYIQPILVSLVKSKKTANLENALRRIKQLSEQQHEQQKAGVTSPEEALKYLLYMVDVGVLFDIALGMYDFELVMFVAQKSQKDPKEYVSFLNELRKLEENYMRYRIDSHLKRYDCALQHIAKIPDKFAECLAFVQTHQLYNQAIKLYDSGSEEYRKVALAYGKFLVGKTKYHEAGIMYHKAANYEEALFAFKLANSWKDAIVTALKLDLTHAQLVELYEDLVRRLAEEKKFDEAATILSKHLNRLEDAVATLCEGRHWHQAWTDAYCMKREDLIETHVRPGLLEHAEFTLTQLRQHKQDFDKHKKRLAVVRGQAAAREASMRSQFDFEDDGATGKGDFSDLISDTTSIAGSTMSRSSQASRSTGRSYRSSKNRRKHERKMQSIKEGSVYEDLALIRALHQLVSNAYKMRDEIRAISEMLLLVNHDKLAEELYQVMNEYLAEIYRGKREIWPPVAENKNLDSEEPSISSNSTNQQSPINVPSNLMDPSLMQAPEEKTSNWKLDVFSFL